MKKVLVALTVLCLLAVSGSVAMAGKTGPAGKSNTAHLYLYEKDPATWEIVDGGAWGKMKYNLSGPEFEYVFNGHGLEAGEDYTLIYYPDPWPGGGLICLGDGRQPNLRVVCFVRNILARITVWRASTMWDHSPLITL